MKCNSVFELIDKNKDIPLAITNGIINLFGVDDFSKISLEKKRKIFTAHNSFFSSNSETDYSDVAKEYTLFYLPVNFYKIWQPLVDLAERNQLKNKCNILDLGAGPGTSSFGLIEFYRQISLENPMMNFNLSITLVEKENKFLEICDYLFDIYSKSFPNNLIVKLNKVNKDIFEYFDNTNEKYDLIIESNMLNPNENNDLLKLETFAHKIVDILKPKSSIILIEPAREKEVKVLKNGKHFFLKEDLNVYSPCDCDNLKCSQLSMGSVSSDNLSILKETAKNGLIDSRKIKNKHYYEYMVFRNDGLKKYKKIINKDSLLDITKYIGQRVDFSAFVLNFIQKENGFSLKVCDGSLLDRQIWIDIPYSAFDCSNKINTGRGAIIKIKGGIVSENNRIKCDIETFINIER